MYSRLIEKYRLMSEVRQIERHELSQKRTKSKRKRRDTKMGKPDQDDSRY